MSSKTNHLALLLLLSACSGTPEPGADAPETSPVDSEGESTEAPESDDSSEHAPSADEEPEPSSDSPSSAVESVAPESSSVDLAKAKRVPGAGDDASGVEYGVGDTVLLPFYNVAVAIPPGWTALPNGTGINLLNSSGIGGVHVFGWSYFTEEYARTYFETELDPNLSEDGDWVREGGVQASSKRLLALFRSDSGYGFSAALLGPRGVALRLEGTAETKSALDAVMAAAEVVAAGAVFTRSPWWDVLLGNELSQDSESLVTSGSWDVTEYVTHETVELYPDGRQVTINQSTEVYQTTDGFSLWSADRLKVCSEDWLVRTVYMELDSMSWFDKNWERVVVLGDEQGGRVDALDGAGATRSWSIGYHDGQMLINGREATLSPRACSVPNWVESAFSEGEVSFDSDDPRYWDEDLSMGATPEAPPYELLNGTRTFDLGSFTIAPPVGWGLEKEYQESPALLLVHPESKALVLLGPVASDPASLRAQFDVNPQDVGGGTLAPRVGDVEQNGDLLAARYHLEQQNLEVLFLARVGPANTGVLFATYTTPETFDAALQSTLQLAELVTFSN